MDVLETTPAIAQSKLATAQSIPQQPTPKQIHTIAIVGSGPKGFFCLERLLAEFQAAPLQLPLQIHVFNRSPHFGASPVYDPNQPEYIAANLNTALVDSWDAPHPPSVAGRGPSFVDWYHQLKGPPQPLTGEEY
ncbi:MAG: FAD/NAD(P)-binding protein, partial [Symploca sp. SIO3E6]|nr:FAD/NAD(P)-binding protein [Caldora sp. SIO3E6]